ncbi:MAG: bifunctional (p)ppGpp synthetase/guanosine-3',5'-bis(diphosphate) 3'-pyrophosphohydrolase [Acidobacteria bacterium]|nr:bifunctional (p)ppGpp synthetase/guanosine-3',5'-bis(diphosphate) 3'-pyrophosphohydrolase [Acidobacteriota bacterium]
MAAKGPSTIKPGKDSGMDLEAALPVQPATASVVTPQASAIVLPEPEGTLPPLKQDAVSDLASDTSAVGYGGLTDEQAKKIDAQFEDLLHVLHQTRPNDDLDIVRDAWRFCMEKHTGQLRASGEPYIIHPLEVAHVLAEMKMDATAVAAGLLHDAVEDTDVSTPEIARRFGEQVAHIVEGVTKLDRIKFANKEDHQAENIRKMLLAMVTDIRVVLIKMADRLHNMRTLEHLKPEKQVKIARETLEIYAPLAHRLGMGRLRSEFEDLSFRYVDPEGFEKVSREVEDFRTEGEHFLQQIVTQLKTKLAEQNIRARVEYRIKRLYSIQQKLTAQNIEFDQLYDLLAVRVITETVQDCYATLGLLHSVWRPVPGRIKDFIAMPRPNLYQSLHTTLVAEGGHQFEVQIRTEDMHRIAEEGIAAHWKYKANESVSAKDEQRLAWVRQLMEWQREMTDPNEFMSTLKIDLYPEEVYTFTPKGKVVVLPKDATPVDFAYTIHTEVGQSTVGAKVNGRIVPLRTRLRNGDIVEIQTQAGHTPSRDWLNFVKSSRARNKIKHWLNEHQRERAMEIGRKLLEREARKWKVSLHKFTDEDYNRIAADYGLTSGNELLSAIGFGKYSARVTLNKLQPGATTSQNEQQMELPGVPNAPQMSDAVKRVYFGKGSDSLQVEGQDDLLVYRARCCNPIRGEEIIGYVTRGKGVAVHARSCPNVQNLLYESDRRIQVEWGPVDGKGSTKQTRYPVKLLLHVDDRSGMLKELTAIISDDDTNIRSVDSHPTTNGEAAVEFVIETQDVRHLNKLLVDLKRVNGVRDVQRVQKV